MQPDDDNKLPIIAAGFLLVRVFFMFCSIVTCLVGGLVTAAAAGPGLVNSSFVSGIAPVMSASRLPPHATSLREDDDFSAGVIYHAAARSSAPSRNASIAFDTKRKPYVSTEVAFRSAAAANTSSSLQAESADSSDAFVTSIGMNAHFESPTYSQNYPRVTSLIANLGIRHYRVSAAQILFQPNYRSELAALYSSYGTQFNVLVSRRMLPAQIVQAIGLLPAGSVESVEGPNENDNPGQGPEYDPNFATDVPAYMRSLYPTIKSTPATSSLPVIGPSFSDYRSYAAVGNLSSLVDAGNMHNYFSGFNPGTPGWGGYGSSFAPNLRYGSIDWNIAASGQSTGSKPVVATETGYYTAAIRNGVPLDVQAKYVPRLYLEQYRHHVARTFMYQLIGYDTTTADGSLDIVSPALVPSPAYNALAGMISLLSEGGRQSSAASYNWSLTGQTANVDHQLLHKVDGTLIIALWIESLSYNPNAGVAISVPRQTVSVNIAQLANFGVLWTYDPVGGAWSSSQVAFANGATTVNIGDSVSILEIGPSALIRTKNALRLTRRRPLPLGSVSSVRR